MGTNTDEQHPNRVNRDSMEKELIELLNKESHELPPYLRTEDNTFYLETEIPKKYFGQIEKYMEQHHRIKIDISRTGDKITVDSILDGLCPLK